MPSNPAMAGRYWPAGLPGHECPVPIPDDATVYVVARRGDWYGHIPVPRTDLAGGKARPLQRALDTLDATLARTAEENRWTT